MPRVGKQKLIPTKEELARRRPVVLQGDSAIVSPRSVTGAAGTISLADALGQINAEGGRNVEASRYWEEDPVAWAKEKHPKIESKIRGLIPYQPWDFQEALLRYVSKRKALVIEKSRQLGVSTTIIGIGFAYMLLYSHKVTGIPCHAHIIANKEETALRLIKMVKIALSTADLDDEERENVYGADPGFNNEEIRYNTPTAQNYVRAHTSSDSAGRSFDGNLIALEEFAFLPAAQKIWTNIQPMILDLPDPGVFVVSTHNGEGNFFCELVDRATEKGLTHIPLPWQVHPERDEAWRIRSQEAFEGSLAEWEQEFALRRIRAGDAFLNMDDLREKAGAVAWVGETPIVGHRYAKAVDVAGPGQDLTVHTVIDLDADPAQVVYQKHYPNEPVLMKVQRIEELDQLYPGPLYIDGTGDPSLPALVRARNLIAIRFSGGSKMGDVKVDKAQSLRWRVVARSEMRSWWVTNLERGRVVVHPEHFPQLWQGLATAHYGPSLTAEGGAQKRKGKFVDFFDSAMLANLALARGRKQRDGGNLQRFAGLKSHPRLAELRGARW